MSDNTYNGWTNYPTWLVNLWLTNETSTYSYWLERTSDLFKQSQPTAYLTCQEKALTDLSRELEDTYAETIADTVGVTGFMTDLLTWSLDQVDWRSIAEHLADDRTE